jgi:hypothetical protein
MSPQVLYIRRAQLCTYHKISAVAALVRLVPETPDTHGHGTHTWAVNWKADLLELLARSK